MEQFIMENPTLFGLQDYKNFVTVGFITQDEYEYLMATYGPQPNVESSSAEKSGSSSPSGLQGIAEPNTSIQNAAVSSTSQGPKSTESAPESSAPQSSSVESAQSSSAPQSLYQPNQSSNATK